MALKLPSLGEQGGTDIFDAQGNLAYSVKNINGVMTYIPGAGSASQQTENAALDEYQKQALARLGKTPEEYTRSADQAAAARTASIMGDVNREAATGQRNIAESMNAKGMWGRMYADTANTAERSRLDIASKVGAESTAFRDQLVKDKIGQDVGLFNLYRSANDSNWAKTMQLGQFAGGQQAQQNQYNLGAFGQNSANALNANSQESSDALNWARMMGYK